MTEKERTCNQLFLLVGSNPLPNYITALILKPTSIRLFYSPETEKVKNQLRKGLEVKLQDAKFSETCIEDVTSAAGVRKAFDSIPSGVHLHYTGGTKIMAAHARMAFGDANRADRQASYLDERKGVLRFDKGNGLDLSQQDLGLTVNDVLALHGICPIGQRSRQPDDPTENDARIIANAVLNDPSLAEKLYQIHRDKEKNNKRVSLEKAKCKAVKLDDLGLGDLRVRQVPEANWEKKTYETWLDFLGGGWMETWCRTLVGGIVNDVEKEKIAVGLNCELANGRLFEIDVALVRGHRLYVISCTTDTTIGLCKSKLFEVAMRARQLGGDLARSALMCLLQGSDPKGAFVDQLRNDVADIWDAPNTPQVYGLGDLKEWAGIGGPQNMYSLKKWLDS